jgi:glutamate racemase
MSSLSIGIFDSGIGGLTVVKEILSRLPSENLIYLGDTARVPYGTRGKEIIKKFALQLTDFLLKRKVKILVVACNTISATCLDEIRKVSPVPVLGVIDGAVSEAIKNTKTNVIGVIGTTATISSKVYEKSIKEINPKIKVISKACPLFVPIAEEGLINDESSKLIAKKYLKVFKKTKIDTLILGCTHYPVLKKIIQQEVGPKIKLVDSAKPLAEKLKKVLDENKIANKNKFKNNEFFVTDAPERVYKVSASFLSDALDGKLKKIDL